MPLNIESYSKHYPDMPFKELVEAVKTDGYWPNHSNFDVESVDLGNKCIENATDHIDNYSVVGDPLMAIKVVSPYFTDGDNQETHWLVGGWVLPESSITIDKPLHCIKCQSQVVFEDSKLTKGYVAYCPTCDEDLFSIEVVTIINGSKVFLSEIISRCKKQGFNVVKSECGTGYGFTNNGHIVGCVSDQYRAWFNCYLTRIL